MSIAFELSTDNFMGMPPRVRHKLIAFCCGWRVESRRQADVRGYWRTYYQAVFGHSRGVQYCTPVKTWNWIIKNRFPVTADRFLEYLSQNDYTFTVQPSGLHWVVILEKGISRERIVIVNQKQFLVALEGLFLTMHTAFLWGKDLGFALDSPLGEKK